MKRITLHMQAVGDIGVGKSTLLQCILDQFPVGQIVVFGEHLTVDVKSITHEPYIRSDKPMERVIIQLEAVEN